jgi:hypothetical protein
MTSVMKEIESAYAAKRAAADSEAAQNKLKAAMDNDIKIVAGMRDRIRGTYAYDPQMRSLARLSQNALKINNIISSHGMAVASLPDFAGVVFRNGFEGAFRDAWLPFFNSLIDKEAWQAVKAAGQRVEGLRDRHRDAIGLPQPCAQRHQRELPADLEIRARAVMGVGQGVPGEPAGAADRHPEAHGDECVSHNILRMSQAVAEGKATAKDIQRLPRATSPRRRPPRSGSSSRTTAAPASKASCCRTPRAGPTARRKAFVGAVGARRRHCRGAAGPGEALLHVKPGYNVLGQYKAFSFASTQRILIANLQRHDAASLSGLITARRHGHAVLPDQHHGIRAAVSERPQDWIKEGISRGGILGVIDDANNFAAKATGGKADLYRLYRRRQAADQVRQPGRGEHVPGADLWQGAEPDAGEPGGDQPVDLGRERHATPCA